MIRAVGLKGTISLFFEYPAMILLPVFSYWTIGPPDTGRLCFKPRSRSDSVMGVSFFYSFLNSLMSIFCNALYFYFIQFYTSLPYPGDALIHFLSRLAPLLLFGLVFLLILGLCKNEQCCDVPLINRVNFDINEQEEEEDRIEEENSIEITKL